MKFPTFIRIAIVTNFDIFKVNESETGDLTIVGGLESKYVKALSDGLHFKYSVRIPDDKEWGRLVNGKWTGVMGLVATNQSDIGISKIGIAYPKLSAVDFSYPYSIEKVTFATRHPGVLSKETAVVRPFSYGVWIGFFMGVVLMTIAFKLMLTYKYKFQFIILEVIGCFFLQSKGIKAEKLSERILVLAWITSAMLLSYSYTAVLLSFLTVPLKDQPVDNKFRLLNAISKRNYKCFTPGGSAVLRTLLTSDDKTVSTIAEYIEENKWLIEASKDALAETFNERKIAVINPRNHFRILPPSRILVSTDSFFLLYWGIAVNKNFCCKQALDDMVHRIAASGLYLKAENDFYFQSQLKYNKRLRTDEDSIVALNLKDVISAFLFLISGIILSCISLVVEMTVHKKEVKRKKKSLK